MRGPVQHTAEEATKAELRRATVRLAFWLAVLLLIGPLVRMLPLGQTTRTGLLAWLLLALALYWLYAGLGYRPLLLIQLGIFSAAVALLMLKALVVVLGVHALDILRRAAKALIIAGAASAGINLGMMLLAVLLRRDAPDALPQ
jgi:hypothetical protein